MQPQLHNQRVQQHQQQPNAQPQQQPPRQLQQQREATTAPAPKSSSKESEGRPLSVDADTENSLPNKISAAGSSRHSASAEEKRENSTNCHSETLRQRKLPTEDYKFPSLQPPPNPRDFSPDEASLEGLPEARFKPRQDARCSNSSSSSSSNSSITWIPDDCRTPIQQEIPLGSWPSPEKAPFVPSPIAEDLVCLQRREGIQFTSNQRSCSNRRMFEIGFPLSNSHEKEAVVLRTPIPAAATPAYFPI
ncbi:uncharacterized protein EMH_0032930 [Eimeria mitis]|uniref:Uncharacterized protein n=1 Tax=Eimeria mitis TaxID=44415 RepID=U6JU20_9EIME|nr:uncharacterized protein EMH_0032930 [Eimeria mitis]CDJ27567.1 hypothetical protein EMH_0032930 [Eimeria mitis]